MKAYTLRLEDELIDTLKEISHKEKKSLRAIIVEALQVEILKRVSKSESLKEQRLMDRAAHLASRLKDEDILRSVREDRHR
jgi:predicted transcriptional regulator